jgi:microcystin-dependent protein
MTVPYVGAICLFAGVYEIKGWLYCIGQILPATEFTELYDVIGNKYGGDTNTKETFALPDLQEQEKELNGVRYQIAVTKNEYAPELILGSIFLWVLDAPPEGCAFCDGTLLRINENTPLYTILMTKFGGNGTTTFALPNLTEAEKKLNGARYVICLTGIYPPRY